MAEFRNLPIINFMKKNDENENEETLSVGGGRARPGDGGDGDSPSENVGSGTGFDGPTMNHSISVEKADLAGLKLKVLFRVGGKEKVLSFEVRDIAVGN
jgi:hypothetical protein